MSVVSASTATKDTTQTFVAALVINSVLLVVEFAAFNVLKNKLGRIYTPRTYLPPPEKRAEELPREPWRWILIVATTPATDIIQKNGLDAYMFLRFLRLMIMIFAFFTFVTSAVLLPINIVGIHSITNGLAQLSWGNIPDDESTRYAAHIAVVYILTFWVIYLIRKEYFHYTEMRQGYLTSKSHSHLPQARTVLITSIPHLMCNKKDLRTWSSFVPGGVQNIWVYHDTKELNQAYSKRLANCQRLEEAEARILRCAMQEKLKRDQQLYPQQRSESTLYTSQTGPESVFIGSESSPDATTPISLSPPIPRIQVNSDLETGSGTSNNKSIKFQKEKELLYDLVPVNKRPRHRPGWMGLFGIGIKVDTIEYCKDEIALLNHVIRFLRRQKRDDRPLGSAFIQCNLQMGAHVLAQCVSHHEPMKMAYKWLQISPKDVIWDNIQEGVYQTRFRYVTSWIANFGIIIVSFFPVSFVGLLSNVSQLCLQIKWLDWVCRAPTPIPGILQGIFPPLLLALFFSILPWFLRGLAWYENIPLYSLLSISVYKRYYMFLVVHGFLIVTLTSGLTATASDIINSPAKTLSQLAAHLPDASVFFLTWTLTQGLTGAGSALLQLFPLLMYYINKWFFGRTPRQAYGVTFMMPSADFGAVLPQFSLLATIGFAYSVLSPIINCLAMLAFILLYFAWKFLLMWVLDQPDDQETGGLYFPLAMNYLFVGLYIEQFCLAALFFLKGASGPSFIIEGIFMILLLVITIGAQAFLSQAFEPLFNYLPMSLATKRIQAKIERRWRRDAGLERRHHKDFDLFNREHILSVVRKRMHQARPEYTIGMGLLQPVIPGTLDTNREASTHHVRDTEDSQQDIHRTTSRRLHPRSSPESLQHHPSRRSNPAATASSAAGTRPQYHDPDSSGDENDFDHHGFDHPASFAEQPWIWIPKDELGLSKYLVDELKLAEVEASDEGSTIDFEGNVEVTRSPPDEEWLGGHDA